MMQDACKTSWDSSQTHTGCHTVSRSHAQIQQGALKQIGFPQHRLDRLGDPNRADGTEAKLECDDATGWGQKKKEKPQKNQKKTYCL